jgi:lysophospholipase L1-like esterase
MIRNRMPAGIISLAMLTIAMSFAVNTTTVCAQSFVLKDGDTVVFYGDSITAQRLYTKAVEEFVLTRYPRMHIRFVNAGVPGDITTGGYAGSMAERVARNVAPWEPRMVVVMLGMNDGGWGYGSPDQIEDNFKTQYEALLHAIHEAAPGATLTLATSPPYDEVTHGTEFPGYSKMIDRLATDVSCIAAQWQKSGEQRPLFADFHQPMVDALERAKASDPQLAALLIPDRIHPGEAAHWIMATALMKTWHVEPVISKVDLREADVTSTNSEHTAVSDLKKSATGIEWAQLDEALPLPLDLNNAMTTLLLNASDISEVDRQMLRVDGLKPGNYDLRIDGKQIASFSTAELQHGVNLALYRTPMLDQAREIASKEEERAELDRARFALSANVKQIATTGIAESTLRAAQGDIDAEIRKELSPKPHHFELQLEHPVQQNSAAVGH